LIFGVYVAPEAKAVPPEELEYQLIVPDDEVAVKVTLPFPQRLLDVTPVIVGLAFTLAITGVRVVEVQPLAVAST